MAKLFKNLLTLVHSFVAIMLIGIALLTIGWSVYDISVHLFTEDKQAFIPTILQSVGAIVIAAAIIDVAQYMFEEEVFQEKELREPKEARKTITKIIVIISIAVNIEGLVYIFKAGTTDLSLLIYPAVLIFVSSISIVALGVYQKLSVEIESEVERNKLERI